MDDLKRKIIAALNEELGYAGLPHERAADRILKLLRDEALDGNIDRDLADRDV